MDPLKANATITQLAATDGPGFFRENNSKEKEYFFYWVDPDRKVSLLSKTYKTAKGRNRAQKQIEDGAYTLETLEAAGLYGYAIQTKDGTTLALGPLFPDPETRDQRLAIVADIATATNAPPLAVPEGPDRHSFRLDFYRSGRKGQWKGKISYPLSQEKQTFDGIDLKSIEDFIELHLAKSRKMVQEIIAMDEIPPLSILHRGQTVTFASLPAGSLIDVEIGLGELSKNKVYEAQVLAKSLESGEQTLVGRQKGDLAAGQALRMQVITQGLNAGLYRLEAAVGLSETPYAEPLIKQSSVINLL